MSIRSFDYHEDFKVTGEMKKCFKDHGYVVVRGLLDSEEVEKLKTFVYNDQDMEKYAYGRDDGKNMKTKVVLWNQISNDVTGIIASSDKVAGTMSKFLKGEIYHYHAKIIHKEAFTGGMHVWHQDYGYWYNFGCLYPNMGTVSIAVERAYKGNGCLQILDKSHKFGRVDHSHIGDQAGINDATMSRLLPKCNRLHVEMEPGDAMFFHCNLIHKSEQNHSPDNRMAYLIAYNRADNNPVINHHHASYTPLHILPNHEIKKCSTKPCNDKDFFELKDDIGVVQLPKASA